MKLEQRLFTALCLVVFTCSPTAWSETAETQRKASKYVCVPNAQSDGWVCDPDRGQRPAGQPRPRAAVEAAAAASVVQSAADPTTPATAEGAQTSAVAQASAVAQNKAPPPSVREDGADPNTGMSLNPEDWYTPTPARATDPEHAQSQDLASALWQAGGDGLCAGEYRQREYPHPVDADNESFPVVALADELSTQIDVAADFTGNVTIEQGNRVILAGQAELDYPNRQVHFPHGVRMDQPGLVMQGRSASVHLDSEQASLDGAQFLLLDAQMRGQAEQLAQSADGDLLLADNVFTRCEPGNNGWSLKTKQLVIEEGDVWGTAKHAVLRMKGVPIFYSPYLQFPVSDERVSGFLFPNMGYSDEDGVDFSIPYYFNLAPNYDATLIPRYMSERGAGGELELRHMSAWQSTTLSGAMLPDDDLYNGFVNRDDFDDAGGEALFGPFETADRWLGAIDHRGGVGPFRTRIDYTSVSDRDYFRDLGSDLGVSSRRELERRGEIRYNRGNLSMRVWAQRFQRLDEVTTDVYERVPEFEVGYVTPLVGPLEFSVGGRWSEFDRDTDGLNGLAAVTGSRTHIEPRLRMVMSKSWGFLNLSGGYRYTSYDLEQDPNARGVRLVDDSPDRNIGLGSLDAGLIFERDTNLFGQDLIQSLEPRVYYLYQEFDEQSQLPRFDVSELTFGYSQLFRDNRFSGLDRIGDADQASAGLTTRFLSRASGKEYFRFSVGEIFYFQDREVTLAGAPGEDEMQSSSAIASEVSALLGGNWRITGNIVWDPHDNEVDEGGAGLQYRRDNRHIFNVGFRNRRANNIEQTDVSLYWPITRHLAVLGRWNYDLVSGRTIEAFGGIEYGDCCLQVRLMARRFLDSPTAKGFGDVEADEGVYLQIVFKGLAGFGTKVESVLERGIRGYRTPRRGSILTNGQ